MPPSPRISLVIPARNEAALLPRLLDTVDAARARYTFGADALEVIVANNASTDDTATIASRHGCRVVDVVPRIIAAVRNGGAAVATGSFLAFVDADMQVHPETFNAIDGALSDTAIVGGATGIRAERWSAGIAASFGLLSLVAMLTGIDAGVCFCRREDFEALGGYDERRSAAEDVDMLLRLQRLGKSRGQRMIRARSTKAVYSTRKFDRFGDWHCFALAARMVLSGAWRPHARTTAVSEYWYEDDR